MKGNQKARRPKKSRQPLERLVAVRWPEVDPVASINGGLVLVDGVVVTNPAAQVLPDAALRLLDPGAAELAGTRKLSWALSNFGVWAEGATVLDVGASTGGFTTAWLAAGATRVFAVDVGHGQL